MEGNPESDRTLEEEEEDGEDEENEEQEVEERSESEADDYRVPPPGRPRVEVRRRRR